MNLKLYRTVFSIFDSILSTHLNLTLKATALPGFFKGKTAGSMYLSTELEGTSIPETDTKRCMYIHFLFTYQFRSEDAGNAAVVKIYMQN